MLKIQYKYEDPILSQEEISQCPRNTKKEEKKGRKQ
jgi:hypothetical protein